MFRPNASHKTNRPWQGGRGAGIATNGMGRTGHKRLPRARRMALKASKG